MASPPTQAPTIIPNDFVLWGTPLPNVIIAGLALLGAVIAPFITRVLFRIIRALISRYSEAVWGDILQNQLYYWASWLARTGLFWASFSIIGIPENIYVIVHHFVSLPFVIVLFMFTNAVFKAVSAVASVRYQNQIKSKSADGSSQDFAYADATKEGIRVAKYLAYIVVLVIGCVIQRLDIVTFLQDASIISLVVVFALQPWLKNLLGGATIFSDRKFNLHDTVTLGGVHGTVKSISLRTTTIECEDHSLAHVPNHLATSCNTINYSKRSSRLIKVRFRVSNQTSTRLLRKLVNELDMLLQTLHPSLLSHRKHTVSEIASPLRSETDRNASEKDTLSTQVTRNHFVLLEGMYQILVWAYVVRDAVGDQAMSQIKSEMILAIKETMETLGIDMHGNVEAHVEHRASFHTVSNEDNSSYDSDDDKIVTAGLILS